jgi:hypothetical protein
MESENSRCRMKQQAAPPALAPMKVAQSPLKTLSQYQKRVIGVEPTTFTLATSEPATASDVNTEVKEDDAGVCTPVCTDEANRAHGDGLNALAAILRTLSNKDRAKLAALLLGH